MFCTAVLIVQDCSTSSSLGLSLLLYCWLCFYMAMGFLVISMVVHVVTWQDMSGSTFFHAWWFIFFHVMVVFVDTMVVHDYMPCN